MKKDNKGLTLIELVVTIAIIAIFSGVVLTFIGTGANSYRNTSSNAEAQMEVQQALDQIQNIVIDVNRGVYYAAVEGDALADPDTPGTAILNDIDQGDGLSKALYVTSAVPKENGDRPNSYEYFCEIIQWNSASKEIEYGAWTWEGIEPAESESTGKTPTDTTAVSSAEATAPEANPDQQISPQTTPEVKPTSKAQIKIEKTILAEDITGFEVDISKAANKRVVRFQLMTDKRGKTIKTLHTVNLRNQIKVDKPEIDYGTAQPVEARIWIDDRYPREMKAGTQSSDFYPKMIGNINPDTVNWVIESIGTDVKFTENSYEKTILDVPKDTKTEEIKIHVEAKTSDGKTVQSEPVTIKIIAEVKPTDLVPDKKSLLLAVGNEYNLNALINWTIKKSDGTETLIESSMLTWTDISNNCEDSFILQDKVLTVKSDIGTVENNSQFSLKASYTDNMITLEKTITVILARLDIIEPSGIYAVGEPKPLQVEYKEGGSVIPDKNIPIKVIRNTSKNNEYNKDLPFSDDDIGDWEIEAEYQPPEGMWTLNARSSFTVKKAVTAEIILKKNNIFPGEKVEFKLKLTDKNGNDIDGSVNWTVTPVNLGTLTYSNQDSILKDEWNSFTAKADAMGEVEITAQYKTGEKEDKVSTKIYISPLVMFLNHKNNTLYPGMAPETITAQIFDAEKNTNVTDKYDIEWKLSPEDNSSYSITGNGMTADFNVTDAIAIEKTVTVTAIAKDKNSKNITCSATTTLRVTPKTTKVKSYNCSADQTQKLEFDPEDSSQKLQQMKVSYLPAIGGSPVSVDINNIPTLILTGTTPGDLSIKMNKDSGNFDQYKYILISAELETVLYNFYIYPIKNNIYNGEYGTTTEAIAYAPYDLEAIKKLATLLPEDKGYTYKYIDNTNTPCEIRLSIHTKTGVGTLEGLLCNSSMNKWFMKRGDDYYRYDNGGWYKFKNDKPTIWKLFPTQYTGNYWVLDEEILLIEGWVSNKIFWQKWN